MTEFERQNKVQIVMSKKCSERQNKRGPLYDCRKQSQRVISFAKFSKLLFSNLLVVISDYANLQNAY